METLHNEQTLLEGRQRVCESLGWTPTDEDPLPPGIIEHMPQDSSDEVTYSHSITGFLNATIVWYEPQGFGIGSDIPAFDDRKETSVIDAIHDMAEWQSCQLYMARNPPTDTISNIFERMMVILNTG